MGKSTYLSKEHGLTLDSLKGTLIEGEESGLSDRTPEEIVSDVLMKRRCNSVRAIADPKK